MLQSFKTHFTIHPNQRPYNIVSIHSPWRKMPPILDKIKEEDIDIRRAFITKNTTVLYVKDTEGRPLSFQKQNRLSNLLSDYIVDKPLAFNIQLAKDTEIMVYNIANYPYTVLEFNCTDRPGLLCDLLDLLAIIPIEIHIGYINTVKNYAHNILHIHHHNRPLTEVEIQYIQNIFEYEVKAIVNNEISV